MEQGTNTNPINIATQKDANSMEINIYSNVKVQTIEISNAHTDKNEVINGATWVQEEHIIPRVRQENATNMKRGERVLRTPYQYPNHKG